MTGADLIEALRRTGTGEPKLAYLQKLVEQRPGMTGDELVAAMADELRDRRGKQPEVQPLTLEKARALAGGANVNDFLGVPPKNAEEAKLKFLAQSVGEALVETIANQQAQAQAQKIGLPDLKAREKKG